MLTPPLVDAAVLAFGRSGEILERGIIGDDDRKPVANVNLTPWRAICALHITCADGERVLGTGWFVDPRTVITAGHCVFMSSTGGWARSIEIIPALDGAHTPPFGVLTSTRFRATDGWVRHMRESCDFGAILLDSDVGAHTGYFRIAAMADDEIRRQPVNISGYPMDREGGTKQYFHARVVTTVAETRLYYDIDTFGGQSGAPAWLNLEGEGPITVGIHTTGGLLFNSGTRLTLEVVDNVRRWCAEAAGK